MKKALFTLAFALSATAGFAQTMTSAAQVCQKIASVNGSNGAICAQLISRNTFDQATLQVASRAVEKGSSVAIEVLQAGANRRLEMAAGQTCEQILAVNAQNGVLCVKTLVDTLPSMEVLRIANALVPKGSSHAIGALQAGANAYLFAPLADICEAMAAVNPSNTVVCIQTIANKVSMNGAEQVCRTSLSQGSAYALQCLQGIVMDYTPIPQPTTIMVEAYELQELKRSILKTRAQLERGMIDNAQRTLNDAALKIDMILDKQPLR